MRKTKCRPNNCAHWMDASMTRSHHSAYNWRLDCISMFSILLSSPARVETCIVSVLYTVSLSSRRAAPVPSNRHCIDRQGGQAPTDVVPHAATVQNDSHEPTPRMDTRPEETPTPEHGDHTDSQQYPEKFEIGCISRDTFLLLDMWGLYPKDYY